MIVELDVEARRQRAALTSRFAVIDDGHKMVFATDRGVDRLRMSATIAIYVGEESCEGPCVASTYIGTASVSCECPRDRRAVKNRKAGRHFRLRSVTPK